MKSQFFLLILLFSIVACKKNEQKTYQQTLKISENVEIADISKAGSSEILYMRSGNSEYNFSKKELPLKKVMVLNASLIGYFTALNLEDKITGVSSPEYIFSEKILQKIASGNIHNIGNEQKYDVEKILALKPDAVFTNKISSFQNTYDLLRNNGIKVIFLDEYLEQKPLEKSSYLKIFGKLFGVEKKADSLYLSIQKNYNELKTLASKQVNKPYVLANEIYGNQWFMPGGKTQLAYFIEDAGANYILKQNQDAKAVPMSFEEVFAKSQDAQYWVNVGNHKTKKELLAVNPNYSKMKVWQNGKLYAVTAREKAKANDFFESGIVRADWVLKDYIKIFHPSLLPNETLFYLKELK